MPDCPARPVLQQRARRTTGALHQSLQGQHHLLDNFNTTPPTLPVYTNAGLMPCGHACVIELTDPINPFDQVTHLSLFTGPHRLHDS